VDALVDTIQRVSQLACDLGVVAELELNPLLCFEHGVRAVDLRARVVRDG